MVVSGKTVDKIPGLDGNFAKLREARLCSTQRKPENPKTPQQTSTKEDVHSHSNHAIVHCSLVKVLLGVLRALGMIQNLTNP